MNRIELYDPKHADFSIFEHTQVNGVQEAVAKEHLEVGLIVWRDDIPLAKAALYMNSDLRYESFSPVAVGAYQAEPDPDAVRLLFSEIENIARQHNKDYLIGPMNGSTWENYRFHDEADLSVFFMEMKHPNYYPQQWCDVGFQPIAGYYSAIAPVVPIHHEKIEALRNRLQGDGVIIRNIDMVHYEADLKKLYPFLHESFKQNFLYTPISESSFLAKYRPLASVLKPEWVQVAIHDKEIVGVLLGVEDIFNTENKTLIIKTLARNPERAYKGLGLLLVDDFYRRALSAGYKQVIFAFMIDEGDATPLSDLYHGHTLKRYTLYGKAI